MTIETENDFLPPESRQERLDRLNQLVTDLRGMADELHPGTTKEVTLRVAADALLAAVEDYNDAIRQPVTDAMVDRFLAWPLPKDFAPDCGISFDGRKDDEWNKGKTWPVGTNLLTADQARAMLEYVLGGRY